MDQRPHILLISADELRKDALGCYGELAIGTPHLDALSASGTQFEAAYANSPLCLPSRCTILTGLYPHNSRAYSNFRPCPLDPRLPNIYNVLKSGGYRTAHVGKCHYAPEGERAGAGGAVDGGEEKAFYMSLGLDHLVLQNGKMGSLSVYDDYSRELDAAGYLAAYRDAAEARKKNGRLFAFPGPDELHPDAWVGRKAVEYIETQPAAEPQFLWVSFSGPHYPFDAPASYYERVDAAKLKRLVFREGEFDGSKIQSPAYHGGGEQMPLAEGKNSAPGGACKNFDDDYWQRLRVAYLANVALIDDWVGRIVAAAKEAYGENLMVIFTADHGEMGGNHHLWGKNGCAYEDVLNVPLLVKFPGRKAHESSGARVMLMDLMPTCAAVAGVEAPPVDGRDLRQSMQDGGYPFVLSECDGMMVIADGKFKYIQYQQKGREMCEAYDLVRDPHEFDNVAHDRGYLGEVNRMRGLLTGLFMRDFLK